MSLVRGVGASKVFRNSDFKWTMAAAPFGGLQQCFVNVIPSLRGTT